VPPELSDLLLIYIYKQKIEKEKQKRKKKLADELAKLTLSTISEAHGTHIGIKR
jgi:hypothetical protein